MHAWNQDLESFAWDALEAQQTLTSSIPSALRCTRVGTGDFIEHS
ncbi:hypothetical protein DEV91_13724 [Phyllobacterium brassicacearum]|nr:hypothetical protein DEV91_13724 [Phyllobacterium brassicacearum]